MSTVGWKDFSFSGNYINGRFVIPDHPSSTFKKTNPADVKELIVEVPVYYPHCEEAIAKAREAFESWSMLDKEKRLDILKKLKHSIEMLSSWFVELMSRELGRPIWDSKQEIEFTLKDMNVLFEELQGRDTFCYDGRSKKNDVIELYKPNGVVAVIAPADQPVLYPIRSIITALLLGNTVVYKPSEQTPLVGQVLAEAVHHAELPKGVFNMIQGERETAKRLIKHHGISTVFFSGTFETASKVTQYIADDYWKILVMGTGGKNAAIIMPDCKINTVVDEMIYGTFVSTGQRSNGIKRIYVHNDVASDFIDKFHKKAKTLKIGHPLDEYKGKKPFMGPLISDNTMQNYLRIQGIAQREGAETLMRGKELEVDGGYKGYYVTPSIHLTDDLNEDGVYNTSEIFGPNVAIKRFNSIDQAIHSHNSCDYGFGISVYCNDDKIINEVAKRCRVGQVFVNSITIGESVKYPISGYGKSGNARPEGSFNRLYLQHPIVIYKSRSTDVPIQI
ncbi:MAG: aldehyde dehydrogenase family protein [Pseudomonadota bacterium]